MRNNKPNRRSLSQKVADKSSNRNNENSFSYLMLPDHAKPFKVKKEGNYRVNIIPYIAGKNNRDTDPGELDYEFTFWIHRISDGDNNNKNIVCPKKTYGKPCPICEQVEKLSRNYAENEDEIKALKAKQRELFNFVDPRDEEQTIMVYDTSYFHGFGEMLDARLKSFDDEDEDDDFKNFADIPGGRTLKIRFAEDTFNNSKFYAPTSIDFVERKEEPDDSIIDKAVCLDSCLKVLSYDEILRILAGTDDDNQENNKSKEEKPARKPIVKKPTSKDDDDDEEDEDEGETDKYGNRAGRVKKNSKPEPDHEEEDDEYEQPKKSSKHNVKGVEEDDDEEDEDEDEEEVPKKPMKSSRKPVNDEDEDEEKPVKKSSKKSKPSDDEEDDDEEDDDEEEEAPKKPAKKKEKKSAGGKCPCGHTFGADCYIYSECDDCEFVDECDAAQDE